MTDQPAAPATTPPPPSFPTGWRKQLRRARLFTRLRPADLKTLGEMLYLLARYTRHVSSTSLPALVQLFDVPIGSAGVAGDVRRLVRLTDIVMRLTYRDRFCMKRSLLLFRYLRAWGYPVRIHFGVQKLGGKLDGHAWISYQGVPVAEQGDPRRVFKEMYVYPEAVEPPLAVKD